MWLFKIIFLLGLIASSLPVDTQDFNLDNPSLSIDFEREEEQEEELEEEEVVV